MAKLNGKNFKIIAKLVEPYKGTSIAIRSDGKILLRRGNRWIRWRSLKPNITPQQFTEHLLSQGWIKGMKPTFNTLEKWEKQGISKAPDGCVVEPDGICPHGYKSWLLLLGWI